ncbi:DUF6716 putative glycosyltransferase [Halomonas sp. TP35]
MKLNLINQLQPLQVVFISAHDAYLKGARNICALLEEQGKVQVSWFTTSRRLLDKNLVFLDMDSLDNSLAEQNKILQQADLIFAGMGGSDLNRLIYKLKGERGEAPKDKALPRIIGYFPGVLHLRIFESLASRLNCDFVLLNCKRDYHLYQQLALATTGQDNGLLFGAPWISLPPMPNKSCDIDLLFVEQSIVPNTFYDRTRLVKCLIALAHQHPGWRVVVALRARKGQASSHCLEFCLEEISQHLTAGDNPLEFVLGDIDELVGRSHRVATISSSVAYSSLAWGKRTLFIRDLGVKKSWGNDLFQYSGYMARLKKIVNLKFEINSWYLQFVQSPCPIVLYSLLNKTELSSKPRTGIFRIHIFNYRLLWVFFKFCLKNARFPFPEISSLIRTVKNINKRIYRIK